MKKPKWHAKAVYVLFALALVLPAVLVASPVAADVFCDFYGTPTIVKPGQTVTFYDMSYDGTTAPNHWEWDLNGDGVVDSTLQNPTFAYPAVGMYTVTLTAYWGYVSPGVYTDYDTETKTNYIRVLDAGLIVDPESGCPAGIDTQIGWNVLKGMSEFWVPDIYYGKVIEWDYAGLTSAVERFGGNGATGLPSPYPPKPADPYKYDYTVVSSGIYPGEILVIADIDLDGNNATVELSLVATKKWGNINFTELDIIEGFDYETGEWVYSDCPGESQVMWYEGCVTIDTPYGPIERCKGHFGYGLLRERVIGTFNTKVEGETIEHPANDAVVHMFLLDGNAPVHDLPQSEAEAIAEDIGATELLGRVSDLQDLYPPRCVEFFDGTPVNDMIHVTKVSENIDLNGDGVIQDPEEMGWTGNMLMAECEEAVKIVFVATYPDEMGPELPVFAEICSWNFWTQQLEKVPQVHWAGEKKVLEKQFGMIYTGYPVLFNLEEGSCGSLFPIDSPESAMGSQQVWTEVDGYGVARAIVESQKPCECDIQCSLYSMNLESNGGQYTNNFNSHGGLINQAGWVVFFLKFEGISLSNVQGERTGHNDGLWDPVLVSSVVPYDSFPDDLYDPDKNWVDDQFVGKTIKVWKGEMEDDGSVTFIGDLQIREIVSNTIDTIYVYPDWTNAPSGPTEDVQWYYQIIDPVWNPDTDDLSQELNVSQDALLRVRVKGWFMGDDLSIREASYCDVNGNGVKDMADYILPAGRWVLPDDWEYLAGPEWEELRPHWDIMDQPNDNIMSVVDSDLDGMEKAGDYVEWTLDERPTRLDKPGDLVAEFPVIGPFSELDTYTPYIEHPYKLNYKTIVRNGKLNWWDCPMPPAKIIFKITDGPGFFKDADKGDVYYQWVETDLENDGPDGIVYTNPYYWQMIPGNPLIPPFVLNGGFDWDSWNSAYGPYPFWKIFNQLPGTTPYDPQHPTKVEVYSDNHGEAMVFLNGDWNLDLSAWLAGAYDIPTGELVGTTTVKAIADYPYMRKHPAIVSNEVEKTWTWGKRILGTDPHEYIDFSWDPFDTRMVFQTGTLDVDGKSEQKMAFIWVCDRDGFPAVGERIEWYLAPEGAEIIARDAQGVSIWLPDIDVEDGFLAGTNGHVLNDDRTRGESWTRLPTEAEKDLFEKFQGFGVWPDYLDVNDYAVAAIEVLSSLPTAFDLTIYLDEREGTVIRHTNLDFDVADDPDDPYRTGDVGGDHAVNVLDMIQVVQKFGETGVPGWIPEDVNKDGVINVLDLIAVGQDFD